MYEKADGGMDTAVWLAGSQTETEQPVPGLKLPSIAQETIKALREAGVLDDLIQTKEGLVVYPVALNAERLSTDS